jgi:hypothetical protein
VELRLVGPLAVGGLAVVLGTLWLGGALLTRRRRAAFASTYASSGGILYTVFQVGCAAALIAVGLGIVVLILVTRR